MKIKNIEVRTGDTVIVEFLPPFNYYNGTPMTVDTETGRLTVRDDVWVNITMIPESLIKSVKVVAPIKLLYREPIVPVVDNFEQDLVQAMKKIASSVGKKFGVDCGYEDLPDLVSDRVRRLKEKVNSNYQATPSKVLDLSKISATIKHNVIGKNVHETQQNCIDAAVIHIKKLEEENQNLKNALKNINIISGNHKVCGKPPFKP